MDENKKQRICAIYARVSTTEQHPEKQVDLLKTFSSQCSIRVFDVYVDKVSGTKSSRPELNRLMFDMRDKKFNCIVIYKLDRLGRSLKHLITICEEFHNKNVDLIVTSQNIDTKTASGKLLFNILGSVAEFERELISERTKLGQRNAKNIGKRGKDKKKRRTSGYTQRWINEGKKMGVP